ncbi:MAG: M3 family metallopeptidase, partial [Thermoanaerobaculia bacterium]
MRNRIFSCGVLLLAIALAGCATKPDMTQTQPTPAAEPQPAVAAAPATPLLAVWTGPYGGVPPFDKVQVSDFKPALEAAMSENLAEIDRIAADPQPPDFENTIAAMERAGATLKRVRTIYGIWSSNLNSPEFQAIEREMAPKLSAFDDTITQNGALFRRIEAVYNSPAKASLTPEQQRLTWVHWNRFVRAGARLDDSAKARMMQINQDLAGLYTRFGQNVLADETNHYLVLENDADLAGLPQSLRDAAAAAATAKNLPGKWVITNTRSSVDPFLTYSTRRDLREKAFRMFVNRGDNGDEHDNNAIITDILRLRAERAKLLGYATHAHWTLENTMAKTPERALELMEAVWTPAVARVREEVGDMQAIADKEKANITIEPWDYRFYAEKVR